MYSATADFTRRLKVKFATIVPIGKLQLDAGRECTHFIMNALAIMQNLRCGRHANGLFDLSAIFRDFGEAIVYQSMPFAATNGP